MLPTSCHLDLDSSRSVIDKIEVAPIQAFEGMSVGYPKILCFMMTHSEAHQTKVKAVLETWGSKCDGWFIASNQTDTKLGTIKMKTPALYPLLWTKLNETLHRIYETSYEEYDYFFKVDDDTFVIMENLRVFLQARAEEQSPQIFGYLLRDQKWSHQRQYFELTDQNRAFGSHFLSHVRKPEEWVDYVAGGSGYIMNRVYLARVIKALESSLTFYGEVPEDMALGATMLSHGISPQNSRDSRGREHFIPESPALWLIRQKAQIRAGAVSSTRGCCARYAISFHHISPDEMHYLHDQFFLCRAGRNMGQVQVDTPE